MIVRTGNWFARNVVGAAILILLFGGISNPARGDGTASPTDVSTAHLTEPLARTAPTTHGEDSALAQALTIYGRRAQPDDTTSLTGFLSDHPDSGWAATTWADLGFAYLHDGYFSRAIDALRKGWEHGKDATEPHARAIIDRDIGELAFLYGALGQFDNLSAFFDEIGDRPVAGSATEKVQEAREELMLVTKDPRHLFNCGPVALLMLTLAVDPQDRKGSFLQWYRASADGTNLAELGGLADKAKFPYRLVLREPGEVVPVPALVHWKVGHFAAIVGRANGRYHVVDPGFPGGGFWVTQAALDSEASGYFLIPAEAPNDAGWRDVKTAEAGKVWGKGPTIGTKPGDAGDPSANGGPGGCGLCSYDIKEATVGVTLSDLPVGYAPPIGPAAKVRIAYNQREDSQPAVFGFFNVSPKWTLNWLTYVTDDPTNPGANVSRYLPGGGAYYYSGYNTGTAQFAAQDDDGSILVQVSQTPITYRRQLSDGGVEIYAQSDGSSSYPRNVFLSQVVDPQGNAVTLTYDSSMRLTTLTDAAGRQTTFTYGLTSQPLLVTQITDPFGRSAALSYDPSGRLSSITDILGLRSSFTYDVNSLVNSMATAYGTTSFAYTAPGTAGPPRFVQVSDPLGYHEREEWLEPAPIPDSDPTSTVPTGMPIALTNQFLSYRDSFYWDRNAYVVAGCTPSGGCDYTKARDKHFAHVPGTAIKSTTLESVKYPLENRIWYVYPGQTLSSYAGAYNQPIATGRVLDDGSTQLAQGSYDTNGYFKLRQAIDPIGRITTYSYPNQIDLASVNQTTAHGARTTIMQLIYNTHHRPIFITDAAGQTTAYTYNAAGQLNSTTNPLGQTTTYHYNSTGDLTSITNANNVTAATYTYDAFDRVASYTDSEGWSVAYSYDDADRLTKITYPDGTAEAYGYDKLDLASHQDRLGRTWTYTHDANRRVTAITDPSDQQTLFAYNPIGEVTGRTDARGFVTQWSYDDEGRLTTKTYADSTTVSAAYEATTSRLHSVTDALGQIKGFTYTKDDQLAGLSYSGAVNPTPNVSFAYDTFFRRLISRTDGSGTTSYGYVPVGSLGALELLQATTPLSSLAYSYDALGRLASRTVGSAGAETFQYDALGRLSAHAGDLGSFTLGYLGQTGQITSRQLASSTLATTWTYLTNTGDRRISSVGTVGLSSSLHSTFSYTSNAEGFTTGSTQTSDTGVSYPPNTLTQTASINNLNQVTNLSGQTLTWDADGNLLSDGARTYSWDAENRLVAISYPGQPGKATAFTYDGLGRRVSISSTPAGGGSATTTNYTWCGEALCQALTSGGAQARSYYAEGEFVPGSPGTPYYYGPDQLGSARRVFSSSSAPTYDYDPYGAALQTTAQVTDFAYAGTFYNADSGLYLTVSRPYDPASGRFLLRDPSGEGSDPAGNLYSYVGGDPISLADPLGLFCWPNFGPGSGPPTGPGQGPGQGPGAGPGQGPGAGSPPPGASPPQGVVFAGVNVNGTGGVGGTYTTGVFISENGDIGGFRTTGVAGGGPGFSVEGVAGYSQSEAALSGPSAEVTVSGGEAVVGSLSGAANASGVTATAGVGGGGGSPVNVQGAITNTTTTVFVQGNSAVGAAASGAISGAVRAVGGF